jgi:hypothetical protein
VWTHLAGVYDAAAHELRLYVDGGLAGVRTGVTTWNASGPFHIGRGLSGGRFAGTVSDVRAWNRALPFTEIAVLADTGTACWPLDGDSGDRCGIDRDGIATPTGVSWTTDRAGRADAALALDGTGAVDVSAPVVFTDRSYTVSAWGRLADKTGYHVAASQDGAVLDAFYLEYHPGYDRWALIVPSVDASTVTWYTALSTSVPAVGVWTNRLRRLRRRSRPATAVRQVTRPRETLTSLPARQRSVATSTMNRPVA